MENLMAYFLLLLAIVTGVAGQLLLKHGMSQRPNFQLAEALLLVRDLPVVSGFLCYGVSTLLYFKVLASLDLSLAYPTVSLGYVLVIVMSKIFFGERVSLMRWAAVSVIVVGVALVGIGGG
jgi:multidrug transporter EmrE-like cation transporter